MWTTTEKLQKLPEGLSGRTRLLLLLRPPPQKLCLDNNFLPYYRRSRKGRRSTWRWAVQRSRIHNKNKRNHSSSSSSETVLISQNELTHCSPADELFLAMRYSQTCLPHIDGLISCVDPLYCYQISTLVASQSETSHRASDLPSNWLSGPTRGKLNFPYPTKTMWKRSRISFIYHVDWLIISEPLVDWQQIKWRLFFGRTKKLKKRASWRKNNLTKIRTS